MQWLGISLSSYKGVTTFRDGASTETTLFLRSTKASLVLICWKAKLGMTQEQLKEDDFLFFFQLILPILPIETYGVDGDPQVSSYDKITSHSNGYAVGPLKLACKYLKSSCLWHLMALDTSNRMLLLFVTDS